MMMYCDIRSLQSLGVTQFGATDRALKVISEIQNETNEHLEIKVHDVKSLNTSLKILQVTQNLEKWILTPCYIKAFGKHFTL